MVGRASCAVLLQGANLKRFPLLAHDSASLYKHIAVYPHSPWRTARRLVGYFEEEAVYSYIKYLAGIDSGKHENVAAPRSPLTTGSSPPMPGYVT